MSDTSVFYTTNNPNQIGSYLHVINDSVNTPGIILLRHSIRPSFKGISESERDDVSLTAEGLTLVANARKLIGAVDSVLCSPIFRCVQTAENIAPNSIVTTSQSLCGGPFDDDWIVYKEKIGWNKAIQTWLNGDYNGSSRAQDVGRNITQFLRESHTSGERTLVISHDVAILAVTQYLGLRTEEIEVPSLGGIFITEDVLVDEE